MMDFINTFIALLNEMSPYLLLGFLIAGILHAFVPAQLYSRHLSGSDMKSVVKAAAFGIPLPLCSCGVIPTASSLRNEGASRGATVSFLIATPQTGVDSIAATYSLLGLPFAVIRPLLQPRCSADLLPTKSTTNRVAKPPTHPLVAAIVAHRPKLFP